MPEPTPTPNLPPVELCGLPRGELEQLLATWGEKPFRARQLWSWVYNRTVRDFSAMSDLAKEFRARLQERCRITLPASAADTTATDGTRKWLLRLADDQFIEMVFIPEPERGTLCVSSQAGCTLACPFCHTGSQGFARNLTAAEIVGQVLLANTLLAPSGRRVTNVVFMGMGEPLYNYAEVSKAVRVIIDETGLGVGTRKLTISTAGVVPLLERVGRELGVNLAISLHSARDEVRDRLVPLNRKYNLSQLRAALRAYPLKQGRRIFWEYVMLHNVNDSPADARALVDYLRGIPSKVNLLLFNPWPGSGFAPSTPEAVNQFQNILWQAGLVVVKRERRGAEIAAACGQLKGELSGIRKRHQLQAETPLESEQSEG